MQYELTADAENSLTLTVTDGDQEWRMTASYDNGSLTIRMEGDGVTEEDHAWLLRELALLLPPDFVDGEEHEEALSEVL